MKTDYYNRSATDRDDDAAPASSQAQARGLVACLPHDPDNVFVVLTVRGLNERLNVIAWAEKIETEQRLIRAGADRVICPPVIGAIKITRMLLHPAVEDSARRR